LPSDLLLPNTKHDTTCKHPTDAFRAVSALQVPLLDIVESPVESIVRRGKDGQMRRGGKRVGQRVGKGLGYGEETGKIAQCLVGLNDLLCGKNSEYSALALPACGSLGHQS